MSSCAPEIIPIAPLHLICSTAFGSWDMHVSSMYISREQCFICGDMPPAIIFYLLRFCRFCKLMNLCANFFGVEKRKEKKKRSSSIEQLGVQHGQVTT